MANLSEFINKLENQATQPALIAIEDKVIVKVLEAANTSKGGIIIPESAKVEEQEGLVLATGTNKLNGDPVEVQAGQYVMFPKFAGVPLTVDGTELRCIRHSDISLVSRTIKADTNKEFTTTEKLS